MASHEQNDTRLEGMIFYVLNRGNARYRIFDDNADDAAFEFYAHGQCHD